MKYMSSDAATHSEDANLQQAKKIDWNDFNYPCCLKIFHFNPDETPEVLRRRVLLLRANHLAIIIACVLNFIANIVSTAQGIENGGIRIAISVFLFFVWLPASFYLLMIPYKIYLGESSKAVIFYVLSFVATIWFFIWSIADFADANGFVMVGENASAGRGAAVFFGVIVAIMMLGISIVSIVNAFLFYKRDRVE